VGRGVFERLARLALAKRRGGVAEVCSFVKPYAVCREKRGSCAYACLEVIDVARSIDDLGPQGLLNTLKLYLNGLSPGGDTSVLVMARLEPVDPSRFSRMLDRRLSIKLAELLNEPGDARLKIELERIARLRRYAVRGFKPFNVSMCYVLRVCGDSDEHALELLDARVKGLLSLLESLGASVRARPISDRTLLSLFTSNFRLGHEAAI